MEIRLKEEWKGEAPGTVMDVGQAIAIGLINSGIAEPAMVPVKSAALPNPFGYSFKAQEHPVMDKMMAPEEVTTKDRFTKKNKEVRT